MERLIMSITGKKRRGLISGLISIIIFLAVLVVINLIAIRRSARFDVTSNKRFTLAPQTEQLLKNLQRPVTAYSFYREYDDNYETVKDLLDMYQAISPEFSFLFVDPDRDPGVARRFEVRTYDTLILEQDDMFLRVTEPTEHALTSTLIRLIQGDTPRTVCFSTGHGELDTNSAESHGLAMLSMALRDANYDVQSINLMAMDTDLHQCDILAIVGPVHEPVEDVIEQIHEFILSGGRMFIALEPGSYGSFGQLLNEYGIDAEEQVILDPKGFQNILQPIAQTFPPHEITRDFTSGLVFHVAGTLSPAKPLNERWRVEVLALSSEESYAKGDLNTLAQGETGFNSETDRTGPLSLAVAAETVDLEPNTDQNDAHNARIVATGDADFVTNIFLQTFMAHQPFVLNSFHWLADEQDLIALPPRETASQPLMLTTAQIAAAFVVPVILIPLFVAVFGTVRIFFRRRRA
jgi:ABC-type uncharacterized transport system involved in gliding motility auxiliary subunit